ncbi:hypothetical protein L0F63_007268, partial [Massospora cicadina]
PDRSSQTTNQSGGRERPEPNGTTRNSGGRPVTIRYQGALLQKNFRVGAGYKGLVGAAYERFGIKPPLGFYYYSRNSGERLIKTTKDFKQFLVNEGLETVIDVTTLAAHSTGEYPGLTDDTKPQQSAPATPQLQQPKSKHMRFKAEPTCASLIEPNNNPTSINVTPRTIPSTKPANFDSRDAPRAQLPGAEPKLSSGPQPNRVEVVQNLFTGNPTESIGRTQPNIHASSGGQSIQPSSSINRQVATLNPSPLIPNPNANLAQPSFSKTPSQSGQPASVNKRQALVPSQAENPTPTKRHKASTTDQAAKSSAVDINVIVNKFPDLLPKKYRDMFSDLLIDQALHNAKINLAILEKGLEKYRIRFAPLDVPCDGSSPNPAPNQCEHFIDLTYPN